MKEYDVAIIDSGIEVDRDSNDNGITIRKNPDGLFDYIENDLIDEIGHGTAIYSIINRSVDSSKIFVVKISEFDNDCDNTYLYAALIYIKNNIKCKIINISMGFRTCNNISELFQLCHKMTIEGYIIISSFDNEGCFSYPAAFDCVIGVDSNGMISGNKEFCFVENSPINILGKGRLQRIITKNGKVLLLGGSSIACAYVTAEVSTQATDNMNSSEVLQLLKEKSKYIYTSSRGKKINDNRFFRINNAVVFPFAKEAHAFLRFKDLLSFQIQGFYDIKQSGRVGTKLSKYYEETDCDDSIKDYKTIDYGKIDTIILGYLDELSSIAQFDYRSEIIEKACKNQVNIYSFDPLYQYEKLLNKSKIKYFFPEVNQCDTLDNTFGKLFKISKPVVGIFGTSSHQGKFSLQISLINELKKNGYEVGAIGTEPHSLLFDFDYVFPMGYNSTIRLTNHQIVELLNQKINDLCSKEKEIIITSSQAGITPYSLNNIYEVPSKQYHFAIGTNPDAIILCINYYDDISYIKKSIYTLIGLTDAKVVAIIMYPLTYYDDRDSIHQNAKYKISYEEYEEKATAIFDEIKIPVLLLGNNKHLDKLCQIIIDYF